MIHNASPKSALEQKGIESMKSAPLTSADVLVWPSADASKPMHKGFEMENSPSGVKSGKK